MDYGQLSSVKDNMESLCKALKFKSFVAHCQIRGLISHDERLVIERSKVTDRGRVMQLIDLIAPKTGSWDCLLDYLSSAKFAKLHNTLLRDAVDWNRNHLFEPNVSSLHESPPDDIWKIAGCVDFSVRHIRLERWDDCATRSREMLLESPIETFTKALAHYYVVQYGITPTMFQQPKHIKDVWVPLQVDLGDLHQGQFIEYDKLVENMRTRPDIVAALIKGDPGVGKTTLCKKIAYDWAQEYLQGKMTRHFAIVIVVPLRETGKADDILHMTIDFFSSLLRLYFNDADKADVISAIARLNSDLLICLDGLDEYAHLSGSPIESIFKSKFQLPLHISYKLLITSRPYACENVYGEFPMFQYRICPLRGECLTQLVTSYCDQYPGAAERVLEHLENNNVDPKIPLIISFICYLAACDEALPSDMTLLYERFLQKMLVREVKKRGSTIHMSESDWCKSPVAKATIRLAYEGLRRKAFTFTQKEMALCRITKESYQVGYLIQKFGFREDQMKAEFPHRTIQEFFAAKYVYQMLERFWFSNSRRNMILRVICQDDGTICRFLFGLCSRNKKFSRLIKRIRPTCSDIYDLGGVQLFCLLSDSLSDCSIDDKLSLYLYMHFAEPSILKSDGIDPIKRMLELNADRQIMFRTLCEHYEGTWV